MTMDLNELADRPETLEEALEGFGDDYMTSDTHHPGYVLIPVEQFDRILCALRTKALGAVHTLTEGN